MSRTNLLDKPHSGIAMALRRASDYDAEFLGAPLRDLKAVTGHLTPTGFAIVVAKNAAITGLPRAAKWLIQTRKDGDVEKAVTEVQRDPLVTVRWLVQPVLRDLAIISTTRALERAAIAVLEVEAAGRFVRGETGRVKWKVCSFTWHPGPAAAEPATAASEALAVELSAHSSGGSAAGRPIIALLQQRFRLAAHTFGVVPYSALIGNAAIVAVDGAVIVASSFWRAPPSAQASATAKSASAEAPSNAAAPVGENEADDDAPQHVLSRCAHLVACAAESVVIEAAFAAAGTVVAPGTGTFVMQLVGSMIAWL